MLNNPLLTAFQNARGDSNGYAGWCIRKDLCKRYAWAVPDDAAIRALARKPLVEIGAGTGYWAHLVAGAGGDVVAYDIKPYTNHWCGGTYYPIHEGGPEMAQRHKDRTLFLCWPPYDEPMATDALLAYEGSTVAYVGEGWMGCTGNLEFYDLLTELYKDTEKIRIPRWDGMHDTLTFWIRK